MNDNESAKLYKEYIKSRTIVILIVILICVAAVWPAATAVFHNVEGRNAMGTARNVEMAIHLLNIDNSGNLQSFLDPTTESGFTTQAETDIRNLSGADGDFYLLSWNATDGRIGRMLYFQDGFGVDCQYQGNNEFIWNVYKVDELSVR